MLVPRELWPDYTCEENQGLGWSALVVGMKKDAATVAFLNATTPRGLPYADADLLLSALQPQ